jgi:hypothetical protein
MTPELVSVRAGGVCGNIKERDTRQTIMVSFCVDCCRSAESDTTKLFGVTEAGQQS